MRTTQPLENTQQILDCALEILTQDLGYSQKKIAEMLQHTAPDHFSRITEGTLSRVKSFKKIEGQYKPKKSECLRRLNGREKLKEALIKILAQETPSIELQNQVFWQETQKYGRILTTLPAGGEKIAAPPPDSSISITELKHTDIYKKFQTAKRVRILHTYLSSNTNFLNVAKDAIKNNGCEFQILLAAPHSDFVRLRAKSLVNKRATDVEARTLDCFKRFKEVSKDPDFKNKFQFKVYNQLPGATFFQVDDDIYVCWLWQQLFADESTHLHTKVGNSWSKEIIENFEKIWENSEETFEGDVRFNMYLLRDGRLVTCLLEFNTKMHEAYLSQTSSGSEYRGPVIRNQGNCINIPLQTKINKLARSEENRSANLMLPIERGQIQERALAVGLYMVEYVDARMLSNIVILENQTLPRYIQLTISEDEKMELARAYLQMQHSRNNDSEVRLNTYISSWEDVRDFVEK